MKITISLVFLFAAMPASAGLLDLPGLAELAAAKAKEAQAIGTMTFSLKKGAGAYLPVWTFKSEAGVRYVRTGVGWEGTDLGGHPLVPILLNLPAVSGWVWSSAWADKHLERIKLPELWFGPIVRVPMVQDKFRWDRLRDFTGVAVSIGLGG